VFSFILDHDYWTHCEISYKHLGIHPSSIELERKICKDLQDWGLDEKIVFLVPAQWYQNWVGYVGFNKADGGMIICCL
jgi:hypothetical protein